MRRPAPILTLLPERAFSYAPPGTPSIAAGTGAGKDSLEHGLVAKNTCHRGSETRRTVSIGWPDARAAKSQASLKAWSRSSWRRGGAASLQTDRLPADILFVSYAECRRRDVALPRLTAYATKKVVRNATSSTVTCSNAD